jgi:hypothetical protein
MFPSASRARLRGSGTPAGRPSVLNFQTAAGQRGAGGSDGGIHAGKRSVTVKDLRWYAACDPINSGYSAAAAATSTPTAEIRDTDVHESLFLIPINSSAPGESPLAPYSDDTLKPSGANVAVAQQAGEFACRHCGSRSLGFAGAANIVITGTGRPVRHGGQAHAWIIPHPEDARQPYNSAPPMSALDAMDGSSTGI